METAMLDPRRTHESLDFRELTPAQMARRKQQIIDEAREARTQALRDLFGQALAALRWAAEGGGKLARSFAVRAGAAATRWGQAYAIWLARRQAIQELGALDDRALKDFGINRSEIPSLVYGRYAEPATEGKVSAFLFHMPYDRGSIWVNPQSKRLVKESWQQVVPIADAAAEMFYQRLFEIDPTTRQLFRAAGMAEQRRKLVKALALAVEGLDNLDALLPAIRDLGRRHGRYGVNDAYYESVGEALLWTLQQGLGAAWTPRVSSAWSDIYALLSDTMRQAAREASSQGRNTRAVAA
jgi:hemoglobin-like flavoprotein/uncharacterized protein YjiS (DUF1127 family)